jgi:hypothetical protein
MYCVAYTRRRGESSGAVAIPVTRPSCPAVHCPPEGRLGLHLASAAKSVGPWTGGGDPATITALYELLQTLGRDMPKREDEG